MLSKHWSIFNLCSEMQSKCQSQYEWFINWCFFELSFYALYTAVRIGRNWKFKSIEWQTMNFFTYYSPTIFSIEAFDRNKSLMPKFSKVIYNWNLSRSHNQTRKVNFWNTSNYNWYWFYSYSFQVSKSSDYPIFWTKLLSIKFGAPGIVSKPSSTHSTQKHSKLLLDVTLVLEQSLGWSVGQLKITFISTSDLTLHRQTMESFLFELQKPIWIVIIRNLFQKMCKIFISYKMDGISAWHSFLTAIVRTFYDVINWNYMFRCLYAGFYALWVGRSLHGEILLCAAHYL